MWKFGIPIFLVLVCLDKEKSGNPASDENVPEDPEKPILCHGEKLKGSNPIKL
jgi:hypothetical protein